MVKQGKKVPMLSKRKNKQSQTLLIFHEIDETSFRTFTSMGSGSIITNTLQQGSLDRFSEPNQKVGVQASEWHVL